MGRCASVVVSVAACLVPLFAGTPALGVLLAFAASRWDYVSTELGTGIDLGVFTVLVTLVWATTALVDVFRVPGRALPAQRFVLVGLSLLITFGTGLHASASDLLPVRW